MTINKNLLAGSTDLLILSLIKERDMYGFEIIRELEARSEKVFSLKEGTLYPVLHRLENKNYLKSYRQEGERGRSRKYYSLTRSGLARLEEEREAFRTFSKSVTQIVFSGAYGLD